MHDYDVFTVESKAEVLDKSREFWNPGKTDFWSETGVDLVIDRRESYFIWDMSGIRLIDVHLNGGTYNLGHRNPELVEAITIGMRSFDIGNHHFPSSARAALAEALIHTAPPNLTKVVYGSGGGEAIDIALKTARHATKRRKIVSIMKAYHGHTGLAVATGDDRFSQLFLIDTQDFVHVPFNDIAAMEQALAGGDAAAVIMETIPATYGFPLPEPGYLETVKALCERHGTLYIADEVQTGLMRTGEMWAITKHGIEPDILVTGKGLSGGMYPIAAVLVSERCAGWLTEDGFAHISSFGGAELGCVAALKTLEICGRPETRSMVHFISDMVGRGLRGIQARYPDWFTGIRQNGVVMGLEFDHPEGAKIVMRHLYRNGVWAIFSTLDPRVLQYKPGVLMTPELCEELLDRTEAGIGAAYAEVRRGPRKGRPVTAVSGDQAAAAGVVAEGARRPASPAAGGAEPTGAAAIHRGRQMLARAHWAAGAFASYDRASVLRIAEAVATAAHAESRRYAEWAVKETGFGVVEHKVIKNEASSLGILEHYRDEDYVSPRIDPAAKILALPRPAGVVLALTPSTNPVCSVFFKVILAMLTRNAIVVSPHPMAQGCCVDAARLLADVATEAGAPDGAIQVVPNATVPLIEALMADPVTGVIVATGGTPVVRAAHRSGNPALGVGPGNVPVLVDETADLAAAARRIADSKSFDNSVLCTNESVLVVQESVADRLFRELQRQQVALLDDADTSRVRAYLFPDGRLNGEAIGKDAAWIASRAGVRVPPRTRVMLTPFDHVVGEEPLAHEKLCPVLGVVRTESAERGIETARAVVRLGGAGHSAAIHSTDPHVIMRYGTRVPVLRVAVNVGNSTGSAGLDTNLAPSMTLGTGFIGRSSIGENLEPRHLVNWTRVAYNAAADVPFDDFAPIAAWQPPDGPVPGYPQASNLPGVAPGARAASPVGSAAAGAVPDAVREQLRALIVEELEQLLKR